MLGARVFRLSPNEIVSPIIAAHSFIWSQEILLYTFSSSFCSQGCFLDILQRNLFACLNYSWGPSFFLLQSYKFIYLTLSIQIYLWTKNNDLQDFCIIFWMPFFSKARTSKGFALKVLSNLLHRPPLDDKLFQNSLLKRLGKNLKLNIFEVQNKYWLLFSSQI